MGKRFIITVDEEEGAFSIKTPDGEIDLDILIETMEFITELLLESITEEPSEVITTDPRKLN